MFLTGGRDGSLRLADLTYAKFVVVRDAATGREHAVRATGAGAPIGSILTSCACSCGARWGERTDPCTHASNGVSAIALLALLALALFAVPANASVVIPPADDDLIVHADAVILGRVTDIESHDNQQGKLRTYITIAIDEVLKGTSPSPR